ncbi:MAG: hypothetical protein WCD75_15015 [Rhodoplanes sp.]
MARLAGVGSSPVIGWRFSIRHSVGIETERRHLLAFARPLLDRLQVVLALLGAFALKGGQACGQPEINIGLLPGGGAAGFVHSVRKTVFLKASCAARWRLG